MIFAMAPVKADEKVIKVGSLSWEDQMAISLVTSKFLEKEGFKIEFTKFSEWGIAYAALQKGDVDILLSNVDYIASDYWAKFHSKLEKVSIVSFGVVQGLVVPSYVPVDSVDQLNTIADKVGGKIIGIEPGSGLMREAHNALKDYDLKYQIIDGSTAAMVAQLKSSLERKEPIVTMLWTPSWMAKVFDVKFLKDPKGSFAPPQAYYWIAKKGFSEKNPHARESLASVYLPLQDNVDINSAMNDGKTIEQAVDDWWQKHQATVEKWSVMSSE
nr:glycine betaine ABC transporter substrate-binding protein [Mesorhizobium silamurunense]